jgi:phosphoribosylaminoimidazole-succinocarboxamide synthase
MKATRTKVFDGKTKVFYQSEDDSALIECFKDDIIYKDASYHIAGKGVINNAMSALLMERLGDVGILTHFLQKLNMREQLVQALDMFHIYVCINNVAIDRYVSYYGMKEGYMFTHPMIEFRLRNKTISAPVMNEKQISHLGLMTRSEIDVMSSQSIRINDFLTGFFAGSGFRLLECRLDFGKAYEDVGNDVGTLLMLGDELTIENCVLSDMSTNMLINLESIVSSNDGISIYQNVARRIGINL